MTPGISVRFWLAALVLVALACAVAAQLTVYPAEAAPAFDNARLLLQDGDWVGAAYAFEQLAGQYPESPSLPLFVFYRAKANYYATEYAKAVAGFSYFLSRFPNAPEAPYAEFYLANTFFRRGEPDRALGQYFQAYRHAVDQRLIDLTRQSIVALFESVGSPVAAPGDFADLPEDRRCPLMEEVAAVLLRRGQTSIATDLFAACGRELDQTEIAKAETRRANAPAEIAVLLPLSGELQEFANEIYNGALVAAAIYKQETGRSLTITPYDTEGYIVDAARVVGEIATSTPLAAVGPLTSEAAAIASARLHGENLPLLIPAATEAGLTRLSETSFQLSPNIELEAVRMADYAVDALGAATAVVIAPTGSEQMRMAERFIERFERRGGEVVSTAFYRLRDNDFGEYIRDIKQDIIGATPDSSYWLDERGDTIENDGLPAVVDVIYLPAAAEQIRMLLPQIRFYNLKGQYLGSDGWGDDDILRLGDDVTLQAVFPSPFLPTEPTEEAVRFAAAYDARYGAQPGRLARLGYDAVRLVTRAMERGDRSRSGILDALRTIRDYRGASGIITFGENRENVHMPLYRIFEGAAVPLGNPARTSP